MVPTFYNTDYQANTGGNKRLVTLYWTALNAASCEIQINDKTYISNAPTKTGPNGYLLFVGENVVGAADIEMDIVVIAHAEIGDATAKYYVPRELTMPCSAQHTLSYATPALETAGQGRSQNTYGIGVTPDETQAFVIGSQATVIKFPNDSGEIDAIVPWLNRVTIADFSCKPIKLNDDLLMMRVTNVVASQDFAYTSVNMSGVDGADYGTVSNQIKKINLAKNKVDSTKSNGGQIGLSLTADGQFLMVAQSTDSQAKNPQAQGVLSYKTDPVTQLQRVSLNQNGAYQTTVTPDGQKVLVTNRGANNVSILSCTDGDLALLATVSVGGAPTCTAVTPDGNLALVTNSNSHNISVINLTTLTVEPNTIPAGGNNPFGLVITSDSQYAYVVNKGSGTITLINISQRRCAAGELTIGANSVAINIAKGKLLVSQINSNVLTSLLI
jgi:YVTN family beta-propeller protein